MARWVKSLQEEQNTSSRLSTTTHGMPGSILSEQRIKCLSGLYSGKLLLKKSSGKKLRTLRTDNGGEFTSTQFGTFLKTEGIRHERTIPKMPEQNGVAERLNRTLVEMYRSMLLDTKLSKKYWAESVSTAVYLKNCCPTKAVTGKTPYEAWFGQKPRVDHLRVFGCDAYVHVPKDERGKLDSKAKKCVLLGYGDTTKGY